MAFFTEETHTPTDKIVTLATAKKHLQLDAADDSEDEILQIYIDAAIAQAENYIESVILERKYKVVGVSFEDVLNFTKQRLKSIITFTYKDTSGDVQPLDASFYRINQVDKFEYNIKYVTDDAELPEVKPLTQDAVTVEMLLGFKKVQKPIVSAILLLIKDMYEIRSDRPKHQNTAAFNLLKPYRYYPS